MGGLFPLEPFYPLHGELCLVLWGRVVTLPREYRYYLLGSVVMSGRKGPALGCPLGVVTKGARGRHRYSFDL